MLLSWPASANVTPNLPVDQQIQVLGNCQQIFLIMSLCDLCGNEGAGHINMTIPKFSVLDPVHLNPQKSTFFFIAQFLHPKQTTIFKRYFKMLSALSSANAATLVRNESYNSRRSCKLQLSTIIIIIFLFSRGL